MIKELREEFNAQFDNDRYSRLVNDIHSCNKESLVFRLCETPLFLSDQLALRLIEAAQDIISVVKKPDYSEKVSGAIPKGMYVQNETPHTTFLQVDFALCEDENGEVVPQLIELQGFPSLYSFQHYLHTKLVEHYNIPEGFTPFFSGLEVDSYRTMLGKVLLGDSDPENVILLEYQPEQQKTRLDFYITQDYYGIQSVCLTDIIQRGKKLLYKSGSREVPIERIYHRFIFDELVEQGIDLHFGLEDELDVTWVGHPNWFFKISKYTMPFIDSIYAPRCYFLHELVDYPVDLENYVLKPLFSFAGSGVQIDVTSKMLDSIEDRGNYILQRKVEYAPLLKTLDIPAKAEVRMMFLWDDEPLLVNNLLRVSKGKMMGVNYNHDHNWVGSSLAYHRRP